MLETKVFLAHSDTTVGFLSYNKDKLYKIKQRNIKQVFLQVCHSFKVLKNATRIPNLHKNKIRRSKKTTFIYSKTKAIRVSFDKSHNRLLSKYMQDAPCFSTSANLSGKDYTLEFALVHSDIILYQGSCFKSSKPSAMYKINNKTIKHINRGI